jgi:hypothetical protein
VATPVRVRLSGDELPRLNSAEPSVALQAVRDSAEALGGLAEGPRRVESRTLPCEPAGYRPDSGQVGGKTDPLPPLLRSRGFAV